MAVQCGVLSFRVRTGTGTQTVTGVVDTDGNAFTPEVLVFLSGSTVLDTLYFNTSGAVNTVSINRSVYRASDGAAGYSAIAEWPQFGGKIVSGGGGTGTSAGIAQLQADAFGGGSIYRSGTVSAVRSGEFDITLTTNTDAYVTDVTVLALAGISWEVATTGANDGAHTAVMPYVAALLDIEAVSAAGTVTTAAGGGGGFGTGWATRTGGAANQGNHVLMASPNGANYRYQQADTCKVSIDASTFAAQGFPATAWTGDNSWSISGRVSGGSALTAVGGTGVRAASGSFTQPLVDGTQTITTGINAKCIMLVSVGAAASDSVRTDRAEYAWGWTNGAAQQGYWMGESATTQPLQGASYLSSSTLLRFATPAAGATTFHSIATLTDLDPTGTFTVNWTNTDGTAREILWFALGDAALTPGSINVTKVVSAPDVLAGTNFDFSAVGLTPSSFTLGNGDTQSFTGLTPGSGYGVQEAASDLWDTTYSVSNGDDPDNISLTEGEIVTVTVTNTYTGPAADSPPWKLYRFDLKPRAEQRA